MCGRCRHVFNAFQFLERVTETIPVASPAAAAPLVNVSAGTVLPPTAQSIVDDFEFEITESLKIIPPQPSVLTAEQQASADAFEDSINTIIDAQPDLTRSGTTSYGMGQTTTFGEPIPIPTPIAKALSATSNSAPTPSTEITPKTVGVVGSTPGIDPTDTLALEAALARALAEYELTQSIPAMPSAPPTLPVSSIPPVAAVVQQKIVAVEAAVAKAVPKDLRVPQIVQTVAAAVAIPAASPIDMRATNEVVPASSLPHSPSTVIVDPKVATNPFLVPTIDAVKNPARRAWVTALYAVGCLCLCVTLAAQGAYHFRDVLVAQFPAHRGLALQACEKLKCVLPWSRNLDVVKIEASDLLEIPGKPGQLVLSATLANRSAIMQDYPLFEVMLTDNTNRTLTSRVFTPQQYLTRVLKPDEGFAPNTEIALTLNLDAGAKSFASGYNMQLVYQ